MCAAPTNDFLDQSFVSEISEAQSALRSYILKLTGNHHTAQDVLQETNIVLWQKRMDWDPTTTFLKWAYRVAYFQTKAHFRDQSREQQRLTFNDSLLDLLAKDEPQYDTEAPLQDALDHCLSKMDEEKRRLLLRRYQPDSSVEELAEETGQSANTLSQSLRRLRTKLSQCIRNQIQTA
ncbi:sigma-70 family RNA polymerase sigma factor [Rubritalea marina]|uniref:sigma-70 family RNA polymerase sigma factor n=1 Tax=Rubritalea marina TaxID=361055 RepID=UPI0003779889|nr:sigma-70 family RNA polymerase sigma factor [Rubritalea marina]